MYVPYRTRITTPTIAGRVVSLPFQRSTTFNSHSMPLFLFTLGARTAPPDFILHVKDLIAPIIRR